MPDGGKRITIPPIPLAADRAHHAAADPRLLGGRLARGVGVLVMLSLVAIANRNMLLFANS
ncbi:MULTISPECIES: hypothetical protein [unclassified Synechococcus]|uniref:hypothetical protein n=1 Tax=unclassified Synechococcus TaxID=2626047 RepID=UPI0002DB4501|nr:MULTISPECIES: hypothetical protein [unclassified Synechococcus]WFN58126.1 hypothetical protein N4320_09845 [Synechococcus sp. CCFWC 502]